MERTVDELESELNEKSEIVELLTQQLEQAAEKLDRYHRSGADRMLNGQAAPAGASLPPEFLDDHKELSEDVRLMVNQWNEMQTQGTLGRMEIQLVEIRDLILNLQQGVPASGTDPAQALNAVPQTSAPVDHANDTSDEQKWDKLKKLGGDSARWDKLKHLLKDDPEEEPAVAEPESRRNEAPPPVSEPDAPPSPQPAPTQPAPTKSTDAGSTAETIEYLELEQPPEEVDFDRITMEGLRNAVSQRDDYICYLLKNLRTLRQQQLPQPPNWEELQNAPDDLRQKLIDLESALNEQLRVSEVELSLERARISRDEMKLRQWEIQLDKKIHQLGIDPNSLDNYHPSHLSTRDGAGTDEEDEEDDKGGWFGRRKKK